MEKNATCRKRVRTMWPSRGDRPPTLLPSAPACPAIEPVENPLVATFIGCLVILLAIIVQLELFGLASRTALIPAAFSRKLTHIGAGTAMTTALVLFPRQYWPARLAVSLSLVAFMLLFAYVAHLPDGSFRSLPPTIRFRLEKLVDAMCRSGDRAELMRGTFYYAFAVATFVLLFWTAPINVVIFASLFIGDGLADPVGRLSAGWASAARDAAEARAAASPAKPAASVAEPCDGKSAKPLLWMQYRVGHFGVKSYPGSLAFFVGSLAAAAMWGTLFSYAGHYPTSFDLREFLQAATLCIIAATLAEAIVRTHARTLAPHACVPCPTPHPRLLSSTERSRLRTSTTCSSRMRRPRSPTASRRAAWLRTCCRRARDPTSERGPARALDRLCL